jgi:hypothetical protein
LGGEEVRGMLGGEMKEMETVRDVGDLIENPMMGYIG